jgi:transitional endoplasmic reticulum ATPase
VLDAESRDVGRGIARIDPKIVSELGLIAGDVIQIIGKKKTSALCWPGHPEDSGKGIIRIDGYIRKNVGVGIDDKVEIKKIEVSKATKITLALSTPRG